MTITYNYKEINNIELYIAKSANNDDITLRISVLDDNATAYDDYGFECDGDYNECEVNDVCPDCVYCDKDGDNLPF